MAFLPNAPGAGDGRCGASTSLTGESHSMKGAVVEVKIGVSDSPRDLMFNSSQTPDEVEALVKAALTGAGELLALTDDKGRRILVQASKITYIEIGAADKGRVGFGIAASS